MRGLRKALLIVATSVLVLLLLIPSAMLLFASWGVLYLPNVANWVALVFVVAAIVFAIPAAIVFRNLRYKLRKFRKPDKQKTKLWKKLTITSLVFAVSVPPVYAFVNHEFSQYTTEFEYNTGIWVMRENAADVADLFVFWNNDTGLSQSEQSVFVLEYFDALARERSLVSKWDRQGALEEDEFAELDELTQKIEEEHRQVVKIVAKQVETTLVEEGLLSPQVFAEWNELLFFLPTYVASYAIAPDFWTSHVATITPVNFRLEGSLNLLVVAHRDKLEDVKRILITPDITPEERDKLEAQIDAEGYSAYVTGLGGVATYPTTVVSRSLRSALNTVSHEWVHNVLNFHPLGQAEKTAQKNALEETTADIIGDEIGAAVWDKYYAPHIEPVESTNTQDTAPQDDRIDFAAALADIRANVEKLLAQGKVQEAEQYMAEQRDWLEEEGRYIRKINQAYLTFRGSYATNPAFQDSNGGVGAKLLELRESTSSLEDFFHIVKNITNLQELEATLWLLS